MVPWAVIPLGLRPVFARNHDCYTILCAIFLLGFQPVIVHKHCCCTVLQTVFLLGFYSAISCDLDVYTILCAIFLFCFLSVIATRWMVSKNRGRLLPWRKKHFCFVRVFRCKTSFFDGGIVRRKKEATIFSILYTYFFCRLLLFLYLYHIKRKTT